MSPWSSSPIPQSFHRSRSAFCTTGRQSAGAVPSDSGRVAVAFASTTVGRDGISFLIWPDTFPGMFDAANEYARSLWARPIADGSWPGSGSPAYENCV